MSDHYAQILLIPIKTHITKSYKVFEGQLNEENMQEFLHLLQQESWQTVYREVDANTKFNKFLDNFIHYYDIAFPIQLIPKREAIRKHWITQGTKN
jgi:predicted NUDIX family phosphoesterase